MLAARRAVSLGSMILVVSAVMAARPPSGPPRQPDGLRRYEGPVSGDRIEEGHIDFSIRYGTFVTGHLIGLAGGESFDIPLRGRLTDTELSLAAAEDHPTQGTIGIEVEATQDGYHGTVRGIINDVHVEAHFVAMRTAVESEGSPGPDRR